MPRHARSAPGGYVYHALNRAVARLPLFQNQDDYEAFERVMAEALERHPIRLLSYCLMPNHWHFVLWPKRDEQLTAFLRWLTHTHTQRWHAHNHTTGTGHLYQGRFKAFAIQEDDHLLRVLRYVERNALRAGLVERAADWLWSSLSDRRAGLPKIDLHPWPVPRPPRWRSYVNRVETEGELEAVRRSVARGQPFGNEAWQRQTVKRLGLEYTMRSPGRPRKSKP